MGKDKKLDKKKAKKAAEKASAKVIAKKDRENAKGGLKGGDIRKAKKAGKLVEATVVTGDPTIIDGKKAKKAAREAAFNAYAAEVIAAGGVPFSFDEWKRRPGEPAVEENAAARARREMHERIESLEKVATSSRGHSSDDRDVARMELALIRPNLAAAENPGVAREGESAQDYQWRRDAEKKALEAFSKMDVEGQRAYIASKREQRDLDANAEWSAARDGVDPAEAKADAEAARKVEVAEAIKKAQGVEPGSAGPEPKAKKGNVDVTQFESYGAPAVKGKHAQEATEVETETGREFAVGEAEVGETVEAIADPDVVTFVDPVTNQGFDPDQNIPTNGNGRPLVWDEAAGKLVAMTRVTTAIDKLENKALLEAWKLRNVLAGVALDLDRANAEPETGVSIVAQADELAKAYEQAIKKTDKLDRKGELFAGERAIRLGDAKKVYDRGMDALAEEAMELAGVHLKAEHGTHLHMLTAIYDTEGPDALRARDDVTPADMADVQAYATACKKLGLEVVDVERRIVVKAKGHTGTLDRTYYYKAEGATRRTKVVGDLKTGRIDYGAGKIATQIGDYADGEIYDPLTHEFGKLGASRAVGLLIHLPAGTATCTIYELDLRKGFEGLKLVDAVTDWRRSTTEAQAYRGNSPFYRELVKVEPGDTPKES
jgi:hypothetical protein